MLRDRTFLKRLTLAVLPGALAFSLIAANVSATVAMPVFPQMESGKMDMPKTPEEHRRMAEMYRRKAAEYRAEADMHRKMLADYKKSSYQPKSSMEAGDIKKMRQHCSRYIAAAENLAREAEEMAHHHEICAKDQQGK